MWISRYGSKLLSWSINHVYKMKKIEQGTTPYTNIDSLLKNYFEAYNALRKAGLMTNKKDFTSQLGEWFVNEIYRGTKAASGIQKDWDLIVDGKRIQVKTHAKALKTTARFTTLKYNKESEIDELVIVVFTEDYRLREFYKVPWQNALKLIREEKHKHVIYWNHIQSFLVAIDDLPNQAVIDLLRLPLGNNGSQLHVDLIRA